MAASEHEPAKEGRGASERSDSARERWILVGLLLFTLVVRGTVLWLMRGNLEQDPDAYREIAENLIVQGEFALGNGEFALGKLTSQTGDWHPRPTAYRPPLYPVVLSNLPAADRQHLSLVKIAVLHLMLGVATVWLTWATTRRVGQAAVSRAGPPSSSHENWWAVGRFAASSHPIGMWPPVIAGLIVACDPILLNQQTLVMTETLAAFLAILSLWCLARFDGARTPFNAALAGGAIGLAVLCRPTFLPWLGLVAGAMLLMRSHRSEVRGQKAERDWLADAGWRVANVAGLSLVAAVVVSPWAIRNYRVFGKPIVTTTHGGYTFYLANNEWFYDWLRDDRTGLPWTPQLGSGFRNVLWFGSTDGEIGYDRWCYADATGTIQQRPYDFAISCLYRLCQLWSPLPNQLTWYESLSKWLLRYATCAWYCGVYAMAGIGIWGLSVAQGTPRRAFPTASWSALPAAMVRAVMVLFRPPWVWGVLLCVAFTAVHTFYWTNLRMRAPLMPFVAMVAVAAFKTSKVQGPMSNVDEMQVS